MKLNMTTPHTKPRLKRVNFRLTSAEKYKLETLALANKRTVSEQVRHMLADVTHDLQTDHLGFGLVMYRPYRKGGERDLKLDVKIQAQVYDYLKINCANLTTCLLYELYEKY